MTDASLAVAPLPVQTPTGDQDNAQSVQSVLPERYQRILACFQLGWKLEELAGVCRMHDPQELMDQPGFPPDLPGETLRQVELLLQELACVLASLSIPAPTPAGDEQGALPWPDLGAAVRSWITGNMADPSPLLTAVLAMDEAIVPVLVTEEPDSAYETAYELGKSLGLTYWDVAVVSQQADHPEVIARAWAVMFASHRVSAIQRRLFLLASAFSVADAGVKGAEVAQAMRVVATSVEYWRYALVNVGSIKKDGHRRGLRSRAAAPPAPSSDSAVDAAIQSALQRQPDQSDLPAQLLSALRAQHSLWYDVLTGRRSVESLCPAGVLLPLVEDMMGHVWRRFRRILPILVGLVVTIAIFGIMVALGVVVLHKFINPGASAAASVLTVLGGGAAYIATIGGALLRRGRAASQDVEVRTQQVVSTAEQMTQQVTEASGSIGTHAATLVHEGLNAVVGQIKQQEYAIMTSEPLLLFVLRRAQEETGDPLQDAVAFLQQVYQKPSNLKRLLEIFPELYMAAAVTA